MEKPIEYDDTHDEHYESIRTAGYSVFTLEEYVGQYQSEEKEPKTSASLVNEYCQKYDLPPPRFSWVMKKEGRSFLKEYSVTMTNRRKQKLHFTSTAVNGTRQAFKSKLYELLYKALSTRTSGPVHETAKETKIPSLVNPGNNDSGLAENKTATISTDAAVEIDSKSSLYLLNEFYRNRGESLPNFVYTQKEEPKWICSVTATDQDGDDFNLSWTAVTKEAALLKVSGVLYQVLCKHDEDKEMNIDNCNEVQSASLVSRKQLDDFEMNDETVESIKNQSLPHLPNSSAARDKIATIPIASTIGSVSPHKPAECSTGQDQLEIGIISDDVLSNFNQKSKMIDGISILNNKKLKIYDTSIKDEATGENSNLSNDSASFPPLDIITNQKLQNKPISALYEYCAKNKLLKPEFHFSPCDQGWEGTLTVTGLDGQKLTFQATELNTKLIKFKVAQLFLATLSIAQTDSDIDTSPVGNHIKDIPIPVAKVEDLYKMNLNLIDSFLCRFETVNQEKAFLKSFSIAVTQIFRIPPKFRECERYDSEYVFQCIILNQSATGKAHTKKDAKVEAAKELIKKLQQLSGSKKLS